MTQMQHSIDVIAVEVERLAEGQRFTAKLLAERLPVGSEQEVVADRHNGYAREVAAQLGEAGIRVEVDDSQNSMQKKIRENARQKVPYLLVVGDREAGEGTVNVRKRGEKSQEGLDVEEFAERIRAEVAARDSYRRS